MHKSKYSPPHLLAIVRLGEGDARNAALTAVAGEMRIIDFVVENIARHNVHEIFIAAEAEAAMIYPRGTLVRGTPVTQIEDAAARDEIGRRDGAHVIDAQAHVFVDRNYLAADLDDRPGQTTTPYKTIDASSPHGLSEAQRELPHLHLRGAAFFDRDNTLVRDEGYTHKVEDLIWEPGAISAIRRCNDAGLFVFVVTNQSGIGRGLYTEEDMRAFHARMQSELRREGAHIDAFYHCPHHEASLDPRFSHRDHPDRKPNTGMLRRASLEWPVDLERSFMVGDAPSDWAAADAMGIPAIKAVRGEVDGAVAAHLMSLKKPMHTRTASDELSKRASQARQWLFDYALPTWLSSGFDHTEKSFQERLSADGQPLPLPKRTRVQARQTIVYAYAGRLAWPGPWKDAVETGANILLTHALRADGGTRYILPSPAHQDDRRDLYDTAFVMFGCAAAAETSARRRDLMRAADGLWDWLESNWRHPAGGYREGEIERPLPRRQNPHMHLFEAQIALFEASREPRHIERANALAALFFEQLYNSGYGAVPEYFDEALGPAPGEEGRIIEPGHLFEWSWLLEKWRLICGGAPGDAPDRLLVNAETYGVIPATGRILDQTFIEGPPRLKTSRLWPHAERMKANLARYARTRERSAAQNAAQAFDVLMSYCDADRPALWRDQFPGDPVEGSTAPPVLASSFYHMMLAMYELISLTDSLKK